MLVLRHTCNPCREESAMNATTIAIDLAKTNFQVAVASRDGLAHHRLNRAAFEGFFANQAPGPVLMEACGTAHHWGRWLRARGFDPVLLPAQCVKPYVHRSKTDHIDAVALLEAARAPHIVPVPIKSPDQQALQLMHRVRATWMRDRTARLNTLRGALREFGICVPLGATRVLPAVHAALEDAENDLPLFFRPLLATLCDEIRDLEARRKALDRELARLSRTDDVVQRLRTVPGFGLITATAFVASVPDICAFPTGRHFASWLGLTPREFSSGSRRFLGRISKQGDRYLRMLLTHGARSVLCHAKRAGRETPLGAWALAIEARQGHNKATIALANKLARIAWCVWRNERDYRDQAHLAA
jgi:transposase